MMYALTGRDAAKGRATMDSNEAQEVTTNGTVHETGLLFDTTDKREADDNYFVTEDVDIHTTVAGIKYHAKVKMRFPRFHKSERDMIGQLHSVIGHYGSPWDLYIAVCEALRVENSAAPRMLLKKRIEGKTKSTTRSKGKYVAMLADNAS